MTNKTTSAIDLVEYLQSWVDGLDGSEERGMLQQSIARINAQSDTITRLQAALDRIAHEARQSADTYGCANCNAHAEIARLSSVGGE